MWYYDILWCTIMYSHYTTSVKLMIRRPTRIQLCVQHLAEIQGQISGRLCEQHRGWRAAVGDRASLAWLVSAVVDNSVASWRCVLWPFVSVAFCLVAFCPVAFCQTHSPQEPPSCWWFLRAALWTAAAYHQHTDEGPTSVTESTVNARFMKKWGKRALRRVR